MLKGYTRRENFQHFRWENGRKIAGIADFATFISFIASLTIMATVYLYHTKALIHEPIGSTLAVSIAVALAAKMYFGAGEPAGIALALLYILTFFGGICVAGLFHQSGIETPLISIVITLGALYFASFIGWASIADSVLCLINRQK